jgi:hypothetical protein
MSSYAGVRSGKGGNSGGGAQQATPQTPFLLGSSLYTEAPFESFAVQMGAMQTSVTPVWEVTPGNFLDGITLTLTSASGVLGTTASITADGVLAVIPYIAFQNTGGGEILYPMGLQENVYAQKYLRPWEGDPQTGPQYSNSINPSITVDLSIGIRDTLAILSNLDARATYRLRLVIAPITNLVTATTGVTAPTVTVTGAIKSWAQPPAEDYMGRPIAPYPPGLGVQRKLMAQTSAALPSTGIFRMQLNLTGNEIRGLVFIFRNSSGARTDLTDNGAGVILLRIDNQTIWTMYQSQIVNRMLNFYSPFYGGRGGVNRETGVYAYPRFRGPFGGDPWLPTVEQSNLYLEFGVSDIAGGTCEIVWDQIAVGVQLPASMESI